MSINTDLARQRNLSVESIVMIEGLHNLRDDIQYLIKIGVAYKNRSVVYSLAQQLFDIEAELQKLWGFEQNPNFYKFWNEHGCSCAKMDNNDNHPFGHYSIDGGCWLHSKEITK